MGTTINYSYTYLIFYFSVLQNDTRQFYEKIQFSFFGIEYFAKQMRAR